MFVSKKRISAVVCVGSIALAAGCAPESSAEEDSASVTLGTTQAPLYIEESVRWPAMLPVPVCWEAGGFTTEKAWTRDAVEGSWGTETGFTFSGWNTCDASFTTGLRIEVIDGNPEVQQLGTGLDNNINGVQLNFLFTSWNTANCAGSQRESCIRSIAVHEFGHALAFSHEQNRPDTPASCDQAQGEDGTATYGAWDSASVMNYCNPVWVNKGVLSPTDIAGASLYYGGAQPISAAPLDNAGTKVAAWRAIDHSIYFAQSGFNTIDTISNFGGAFTSDPAVVARNGRYDAFARGNDGVVYHLWKDGTVGFRGWTGLGTGTIYSNPAAVNVNGLIHLFARGPDNSLVHGTVNGDTFSGWTSLGGTVTGTPSVTFSSFAGGTDKLHVVVRDMSGALAHRAFTVSTSTWSAWDGPTGGSFWGNPTIVAPTATTFEVFVRGKDNGVYRTFFDGSWHNFAVVGTGKIYGSPSAISWGPGRVDVFARGTNNGLWHTFSNGADYAAWAPLGGAATSTPTAVAWAGSRLDTFADGQRISPTLSSPGLYRQTWDGSSWLFTSTVVTGNQNPRF